MWKCMCVYIQLGRLGWGSLVEPGGARVRSPPHPPLVPPLTPQCPPPPPLSLLPASGTGEVCTSVPPLLLPNMYLTPALDIGKTETRSPLYQIVHIFFVTSSPFLKNTTWSKLIIYQHQSFISTSSPVINLFNLQCIKSTPLH